ncbi:hypothetical protein [Aestuariispira ectoiniformans]|uniref:hypothetical protein n=1 Tax=Aestuariispira ectoiniformans TaxID=2775080 RepID=UPI00223B9D96|nr:hypothetical protein [Aestuariispira ectoiniformans]
MSEKIVTSVGIDSTRVDLASLNILLFDTDRISASVTKLALQQSDDLNFIFCDNQETACQHHQHRPFNIALVDFTPTRFSPSAHLVRELRDPFKFERTPRIVALLSAANKQILKAVIKAGVDTAWVKPLSPDVIQKKLISLLRAEIPYVTIDDYRGPDRRRVPADIHYDGEERRQDE